jgi:hypothetical protein
MIATLATTQKFLKETLVLTAGPHKPLSLSLSLSRTLSWAEAINNNNYEELIMMHSLLLPFLECGHEH